MNPHTASRLITALTPVDHPAIPRLRVSAAGRATACPLPAEPVSAMARPMPHSRNCGMPYATIQG